MIKFAVVIFIYNDAFKYFNNLIHSIIHQTDNKFDLIIINDDVKDLSCFYEISSKKIIFYDTMNITPIDIRFEGFEYLKKLEYDYFIFHDCDDEMSINKVFEIKKYADEYGVIVNDIDIIDENSTLIDKKIWSGRFKKKEFAFDEIENYNFVGLGNTSISKKLLKYLPKQPKDNLKAIDWYIFYNILLNSKAIGFFTSTCTTLYRQHDNNSIGIANDFQIQNIIETKNKFYQLVKMSKKKIAEDVRLYKIPKKMKNNYPFWWELNLI